MQRVVAADEKELKCSLKVIAVILINAPLSEEHLRQASMVRHDLENSLITQYS
jgi:hypothetical protein